MNLPVKKVENHTYNLKYGTADSTSRRNSGDAYIFWPLIHTQFYNYLQIRLLQKSM